jgi:4-amino-4-deoxy-L-arabinose transferase-like glycosyltransferase
MFAPRIGLIAAALLVTSPFFLMNAANFMSHNTAMLYLLASLVCLLHRERRPVLFGALAGVAFGLLFNTRPLTAPSLVPAFGVLLMVPLVERARRREGAVTAAAFVCGGLVMLGAYLLYNYGTTGEFLSSGYQSSGDP